MKLAELFVQITGNAGPLNATLGGVRRDLEGFSGAGKNLGGLNAGFLGLAHSATLVKVALGAMAGSAVVVGIHQMVKGASDLGETLDKTRIIMGDAFPAVEKFADEMADKFGLVKRETLDMAASFGGIGKGLGGLSGAGLAKFTVETSKLAADLSSLANIDMKEAAQAMTIGLSGNESDTLKQMGVILQETQVKQYALAHGIKAVGGELSQQQKFMIRTELLTRGLADAANNLEQTQGSAANQARKAAGQFKNLSDEIGTALIPAYTKLLGISTKVLGSVQAGFASGRPALDAFVTSFGDGMDRINTVLGQLGVKVSTAFGGFPGVLGMAQRAIEGFGVVFDGLSSMATRVFNVVADAIGGSKRDFSAWSRGVTSFLDMAGDAFTFFTGAVATSVETVVGLFRSMGSVTSVFFGPILGGAINSAIGSFVGFKGTVADVFDVIGFTFRNFGDLMAIVGINVTEFVVNAGERIAYLGTVVGAFVSQFRTNFVSILTDAFSASLTALENFASNAGEILRAFYESAKSGFSKPIVFQLKPLLSGFDAKAPAFEMPEMPDLTDFSADRNAAMDRIANREAARDAERNKAKKAADAAVAATTKGKATPPAAEAAKPAKERKAAFSSLEEHYKQLQAGIFAKDDPAKKTAANTGKLVSLTEKANQLQSGDKAVGAGEAGVAAAGARGVGAVMAGAPPLPGAMAAAVGIKEPPPLPLPEKPSGVQALTIDNLMKGLPGFNGTEDQAARIMRARTKNEWANDPGRAAERDQREVTGNITLPSDQDEKARIADLGNAMNRAVSVLETISGTLKNQKPTAGMAVGPA